ncbi:MAG: amidohydrolase family protein, partial [Bacteroidota bacterium]|nr:amidohydrolase family protein [Bacteroidota bacterium]
MPSSQIKSSEPFSPNNKRFFSFSKCTQCLSGKKNILSGKTFLFLLILLASCSQKQKADLIIHNAVVYTVDSSFSTAEAFAIKDGKFLAIGSSKEILEKYEAAEISDAGGKSIYPGFIDSHCHFYAYGQGLQEVDLVGTKSFEEVIQKVVAYSKNNSNEWIIGRGWDQNDWAIKEYPDRYTLDSLFPNTPVFLKRIDGHAALANAAAFKAAKILPGTNVSGGVIEMDFYKDRDYRDVLLWPGNSDLNTQLQTPVRSAPTGILIDNAVSLIEKVVPKPGIKSIQNALLAAQKNCFEVGLTTIDDAGLEKQIVDAIDQLHKNGELKMRIYAMLTDTADNFNHYLKNGPYKTERLNVRSFKFYGDGALGSRGACLLGHYSDKPEQRGFLLDAPEYYDRMAKLMLENSFQMNTHCIGDSTVRLISKIIEKNVSKKTSGGKSEAKKLRWRIEHFQVSTAEEIASLSTSSVIPSV